MKKLVKFVLEVDFGKYGLTQSSAERSAELFSEMVPNGLNTAMYES